MNGEHEKHPAGIFIPYEKLLEQINDKLDKIADKLDQKVEVNTFESFRSNFESRHARLEDRVENLEKKDTERNAVDQYRRWIFGGGALAGALMLADIALRISQSL